MKKPIAASEALAPYDVVVVPFPYADRLAEKKRPALVVSSSAMTADYGLVWLAMITSASNPRWDCDIEIGNLSAAGLPAPSLVRSAKLATVDVNRIVRRIGRLAGPDATRVKAQFKALSGI
ncbi:MAG: type II toxin-antitoxin system PemK/MazF family toxin [Pseudomonadota bacterium]|mgnify:CR=1 FL=1